MRLDPLIPFSLVSLITSLYPEDCKRKKKNATKKVDCFNDSIFQSSVKIFSPSYLNSKLIFFEAQVLKKKEDSKADILGMSSKERRMVTILISPESLDRIKMLLMIGCFIKSWDSYLNKCEWLVKYWETHTQVNVEGLKIKYI